MMKMIPDRWRSRKWWAALFGALLPIAGAFLTDEYNLEHAVQLSVGVVVAYVWGQAWQDGKAAEAAANSAKE